MTTPASTRRRPKPTPAGHEVKVDVEVRMYNVGFGDCFLVTLDDHGQDRPFRMLFDCGRHAGSRPTQPGETPFDQVVDELIADVTGTDGVPRIDVIAVTHRHRDHVHGFSFVDKWKTVDVGEVWLPWVEDPENHFAASLVAKQDALATRAFHALRALAAAGSSAGSSVRSSVGKDAASKGAKLPDPTREAIDIAYNSTTNRVAMATLQGGHGFVRPPRLRYLPRPGHGPDQFGGEDPQSRIPLGARIHILGPSRDPEVIATLDPPAGAAYEPLMPSNRALGADASAVAGETGTVPEPFDRSWEVNASEYGLNKTEVAELRTTLGQAALEPLELVYRLDNSINGTSLVILIEIGTTKLLFPGDAQWGTWNAMQKNTDVWALLKGTTIYKVGHHGSHNATPIAFVEQCLDKSATQAAMISVAPTNYSGGWQDIPLGTLVAALGDHSRQVVETESAAPDHPKGPPPKVATTYRQTVRATVLR